MHTSQKKDKKFQEIFLRLENEEADCVNNFSDVPILSPTARSIDTSERIFDFGDESLPTQLGRVSCSDFLAALQGLDSSKSYRSQLIKRNYSEDIQPTLPKQKLNTLPYFCDESQGLGSTPCTAFCSLCGEFVHTYLDSNGPTVFPKRVVNALRLFLQCCNPPIWIVGIQVHKCPQCDMVLARTNN